jgi:hypothetical protein
MPLTNQLTDEPTNKPINQLVTNSMEQSPSWEANSKSATKEFLNILWNPTVHYSIQKS